MHVPPPPLKAFVRRPASRLRRRLWRRLLAPRRGLSPAAQLLWLPAVGGPLLVSLAGGLAARWLLAVAPGAGAWHALSFPVLGALSGWWIVRGPAPLWEKRTRTPRAEMGRLAVAVALAAVVPTLFLLLVAAWPWLAGGVWAAQALALTALAALARAPKPPRPAGHGPLPTRP